MDIYQSQRVRSFNRRVTLRTGLLDGSYLGRGRPLGQARLLFEIGPHGADLSALRERLSLDSGYMSRLLKSLASQSLVAIEDDPEDRRRRRLTLTPLGLEEWYAYDRMSDEFAYSLLQPLSDAQRQRLVAAMAEVETLMAAASVSIAPESADSQDARACVEAYFRELSERFEEGFDPDNGGYAGTPTPDDESTFLVARLDGLAVGCGMLKKLDTKTAEIKRMWVSPDARGLGIARRLLESLETLAAGSGVQRIRLDTNRSLGEAQALYGKAGYEAIERYNDNPYADFWFEKVLETRKT
jgi:DNA-binding MarR family transcriptional regulator/ribosomal protein S18 acetylase RimI-like enzyme